MAEVGDPGQKWRRTTASRVTTFSGGDLHLGVCEMVVGGGWICIWAFSSAFFVLVLVVVVVAVAAMVLVVVAAMVVVAGERKREREMVLGFGCEKRGSY